MVAGTSSTLKLMSKLGSALCFSCGSETASVIQNSGRVRKQLPKYGSYHPFLPSHTVSHKKYTCSAVGSEYGSDSSQVPEDYSQLVSGSHPLPGRRSHHYFHVTLAGAAEKGIAFGTYTAGMSFHWWLEARYCTFLSCSVI